MDKKGCKTFAEFKVALHQEWEAVSSSEAKNLLSSMNSRIKKCLLLQGSRIGC
jgi:DNA-binding MurR/RpiR family transcriptional regulator